MARESKRMPLGQYLVGTVITALILLLAGDRYKKRV